MAAIPNPGSPSSGGSTQPQGRRRSLFGERDAAQSCFRLGTWGSKLNHPSACSQSHPAEAQNTPGKAGTKLQKPMEKLQEPSAERGAGNLHLTLQVAPAVTEGQAALLPLCPPKHKKIAAAASHCPRQARLRQGPAATPRGLGCASQSHRLRAHPLTPAT